MPVSKCGPLLADCSARAFPETPREYGLARMYSPRTLGTNYKFKDGARNYKFKDGARNYKFKDGARIEICGHGCYYREVLQRLEGL